MVTLIQAQKDMLNSRLLAQSLLSHPADSESIPPSPASMSPSRTESLSPSPDEKMSHRHQIHPPYRRKRSQEIPPKKSKNSRSRHHAPNPANPADVKQTFLDLYEVYGVIGVGGGGMVYAGRRITDKLPVAIKRVMREKVKRWEKVQGHNVPQEIALMLR